MQISGNEASLVKMSRRHERYDDTKRLHHRRQSNATTLRTLQTQKHEYLSQVGRFISCTLVWCFIRCRSFNKDDKLMKEDFYATLFLNLCGLRLSVISESSQLVTPL